MSRSRGTAVLTLFVLLSLTFVVHGRMLELRPLGGDNLNLLGWADRSPLRTVLNSQAEYFPEWRPLPYVTVWLQYWWSGLEGYWQLHFVNVLLWGLTAWLASLVVIRLTNSVWAGLFSGWFVAVDPRSVWSMAWFIERQTSMACVFGLLALLVLTNAWDRTLTRMEIVLVTLLLAASALSKEFGLAFAGAVALDGLRTRTDGTRNLGPCFAGVAGGLTYLGLRAVVVGSSSPPCDEMGYFFAVRGVCFEPLGATAVVQSVYNTVAAGINSLVYGFFTENGLIDLAWTLLPGGIAWCALAFIGWAREPRARIGISIVAFNAILNFSHYRDRNHLIAVVAVAIAAGVGVSVVSGLVRERWSGAAASLAVPLLVAVALMVNTIHTHRVVASVVDQQLASDPCDWFGDLPLFDAKFAGRIKTLYGMGNPDCSAAR